MVVTELRAPPPYDGPCVKSVGLRPLKTTTATRHTDRPANAEVPREAQSESYDGCSKPHQDRHLQSRAGCGSGH